MRLRHLSVELCSAVAIGAWVVIGASAPVRAEGEIFSYDDVASERGSITVIGESSGALPGAGAPNTSTSPRVSVTSIYTGCSILDPTPCATETALYCSGVPADGPADMWRVATTQVFDAADTERTRPLISTTRCLNFASASQAGPSEADVREFLVTVVPISGAGTSPPVDGSGMAPFVVNLPVIVFATGPTEVSAGPVMLVGRPVEVSAHVVEFRWESAGAVVESAEPGRAYDGSPCSMSGCGAYLHLPGFSAPGQYEVVLTTTWVGRYRVDGGAWVDIAAPIERVSAPVVFQVREARGVLVSR